MGSPLGGTDGPSEDSSSDQRPLISLVVAMWNVERYLSEFLDSLAKQGDVLQKTEIIFVDDGSPDHSGEIAKTWLERHGQRGRVITQVNSGVAAARNAGLAIATGTWVSFPDPDDFLDANYLSEVSSLLLNRLYEDVTFVAANVIFFREELNQFKDTHPLRYIYGDVPEIIELHESPQSVKIFANSSFYQLDRIRRNGLKFDSQVVPTSEDMVFTVHYQLHVRNPTILTAPGAKYFYRKRESQDSIVDVSRRNEALYRVHSRKAWLEPLLMAHQIHGKSPAWLDFMVLYMVQWYFAADQRLSSQHRAFYGAVLDDFLENTRDSLALMNVESIEQMDFVRVSRQTKAAMLALAGFPAHRNQIQIGRTDKIKNQIQLRYFFGATEPAYEIRALGKTVLPIFEKTRTIDYYGHPILHEKILWIESYPDFTVTLDGLIAAVDRFPDHVGPRKPNRAGAVAAPRRSWQGLFRSLRRPSTWLLPIWRRLRKLAFRILSRSIWLSRKYDQAWEFIDTPGRADESAEHLYHWVQKHHPEINAYFVLSRTSPHWERLKTEGRRLLHYGSWRHRIMHRHAIVLISSHFPPKWMTPKLQPNRGDWDGKFVFLQHGIIKDEVSRSYNNRAIDLFITSSKREFESIAADGTNYVFTKKEVALTGLARFDQLWQRSQDESNAEKSLLTVMPTWRSYLNDPKSSRAQTITKQEFLQTPFMRNWVDYLANPVLHEIAQERDLDIVFMPHSNIASLITQDDLPSGVRLLRPSETDIQDVLIQTAVAITDYSSIAMDSAYIGTPIVYFQFDREEFFGRHGARPGYFDYAHDGFGPVTLDQATAVRETIGILEDPHSFAKQFGARSQDFFAHRDSSNSQRIFMRILDMLSPEE